MRRRGAGSGAEMAAQGPFGHARAGAHTHTHAQAPAFMGAGRDAEGGSIADPFGLSGGSSLSGSIGGPSAAPMEPFGLHARTHSHTHTQPPGTPGDRGFSAAPSPFGTPAPAPGAALSYDDDIHDSESLLSELSIDFEHIRAKTVAALNPAARIDASIMSDADMAGPIFYCLTLGFLLLLTGKLHFGYIYGFGAAGCTAMYALLSLMSDSATTSLDLTRTFSVLGYCLLPIVGLAALAVTVSLRGAMGAVVGAAAVLWCTYSATRFFEAALSLQSARFLIAYPTLLFYACFALITIF